MTHQVRARLSTVLLTLALAGCTGSSLSTTAPPNLGVIPTQQTAAPVATAQPTATPSVRSLPPATGRILFVAVEPEASVSSMFVMNADGSAVSKLIGTGGRDEPAWSSDGTQIAFLKNSGRATGIWVMDADGSNERRIHFDPSLVDQWPVWSPDGKQLAFVAGEACTVCSIAMPVALNVMKADGSSLRKIADVGGYDRPAWSSDGQTIIFAGSSDDPPTPANGLQSVRLDGSGRHQLSTDNGWSPTFSRDGRLAYMHGNATAEDGTILSSLVVANADGSEAHEVKLPILVGPPPAWSPDGAWLALSGTTSLQLVKAGQSDIWILRADGMDLRNITNTTDRGEGFPVWQ